MEFLIFVAIVAIACYFGYSYYKTKVVAPEPTDVLVLTEEVKAEVASVEVKVEAAKPVKPKKEPKQPAKAEVAEKRTRKGGKFVGDDKSTPDVNEAFKDGKAPAKKKKPNMKVVK